MKKLILLILIWNLIFPCLGEKKSFWSGGRATEDHTRGNPLCEGLDMGKGFLVAVAWF